jgi:hypothetical protein
VAYADDGYIKAKLGVALEVLSDMKHVFKEDAGPDLNFDKAKILGRGISVADAHAAAQRMLAAYSLAHLSLLLSSASLVVDGYIAFAVPIGTDAFIQHFVNDKCHAIVEDVDKLDNIQDGFIHYQLIRFCQATRLQDLNGHVQLVNQNALQQQHVDHKMANALLKKGHQRRLLGMEQTNTTGPGRHALARVPRRGRFRSHPQHRQPERGVVRPTPGLLSSQAPSQQVWLPGNELQDPSNWDAPPLCSLSVFTRNFFKTTYDSSDQAAGAKPPSGTGGAIAHAGVSSQDNGRKCHFDHW